MVRSNYIEADEVKAINELVMEYTQRNVKQLKAFYKARGITGYNKWKKNQLVKALRKLDSRASVAPELNAEEIVYLGEEITEATAIQGP